jgi:hypothetical protein
MHFCMQEVALIGAVAGAVRLCWHWVWMRWGRRC